MKNSSKSSEIISRLFGASDIGLSYNLQQRYAGAIEIDETGVAPQIVNVFASIFFHMDAGQSNAFGDPVRSDIDVAVGADRELVLADLIAFRQIGIKVIFSRQTARASDFTVRRKSRPNREFHRFLVQNRQDAREPHAHRTSVLVRGLAELGRAAAEDFRFGQELGVNFETNHGFIVHRSYKLGFFLCHSVDCS